jgi:divalent metal cation (Fe/Co/Zn/Cd) transporter
LELLFVAIPGTFSLSSHTGDLVHLRYNGETFDELEVILNQTALLKRGLLLEYLTLGWNVVGVIIVVLAAYAARSVALAGFGLDSLIEIFASVVVVWQLRGVNLKRERQALRLIGIAFIVLVIYIVAQLLVTLLTGTRPATSVGGIIWIAATLIVMLLLAFGKRLTGQQLKNEVLLTEGRVTLVDAYLAGAVLVGLTLNALFGWWWADPLASLVIIYYGVREAIHALQESAQNKAV